MCVTGLFCWKHTKLIEKCFTLEEIIAEQGRVRIFETLSITMTELPDFFFFLQTNTLFELIVIISVFQRFFAIGCHTEYLRMLDSCLSTSHQWPCYPVVLNTDNKSFSSSTECMQIPSDADFFPLNEIKILTNTHYISHPYLIKLCCHMEALYKKSAFPYFFSNLPFKQNIKRFCKSCS